MQIKLGDKIKELRKRDGRKQEDLANALGVTAQAVSRWEAGGGYPDMGMIPAIANYFHVSIDALFGYNNDRDMRVKEYVAEAHKLLLGGAGDSDKCIALMRKALEEFPTEPEFKKCLANALHQKGFAVTERPNKYLEEAVSLYEELSETDKTVILSLLSVYGLLGEYDKAEKKALEQPPLRNSREILAASIIGGNHEAKYLGEAVLSLLRELVFAVEPAIARNDEMKNSQAGIELLAMIRDLYRKLLGEDYAGILITDYFLIDMRCAKIAAAMKDYEQAMGFFDSAYDNFATIYKMQEEGLKAEHYNTPLLSEVGDMSLPVVMVKPELIESAVSQFPSEMQKRIKKNPKYVY
ncbi:MAG: helix-turn-helix transcriptional regulator [Lachnospiraceae bacterium]|nr:helix-turn-helix transcriptional regulator [Lachnospiraceae bacterium]